MGTYAYLCTTYCTKPAYFKSSSFDATCISHMTDNMRSSCMSSSTTTTTPFPTTPQATTFCDLGLFFYIYFFFFALLNIFTTAYVFSSYDDERPPPHLLSTRTSIMTTMILTRLNTFQCPKTTNRGLEGKEMTAAGPGARDTDVSNLQVCFFSFLLIFTLLNDNLMISYN